MLKSCFLSLILLFSSQARAAAIGTTASERMLDKAGRGKIKQYDREALVRQLDETTTLVEELCAQIKNAPGAEVEEIWASGTRDFKLDKGEVKDLRKATEATLQAMALDPEKAKAVQDEARGYLRDHHKKQSEEYIRDLRNYLTVSEGMLRHANEKREREAKAAALTISGTAK